MVARLPGHVLGLGGVKQGGVFIWRHAVSSKAGGRQLSAGLVTLIVFVLLAVVAAVAIAGHCTRKRW